NPPSSLAHRPHAAHRFHSLRASGVPGCISTACPQAGYESAIPVELAICRLEKQERVSPGKALSCTIPERTFHYALCPIASRLPADQRLRDHRRSAYCGARGQEWLYRLVLFSTYRFAKHFWCAARRGQRRLLPYPCVGHGQ